jgi:hypothetical protein
MGRVISGITTSVDGYITGPNDGPGRGLGDGGERLHAWVFGGHWSYEDGPRGEATGADKDCLDAATASVGAVIGVRWTYEAADHWGGANPWLVPFRENSGTVHASLAAARDAAPAPAPVPIACLGKSGGPTGAVPESRRDVG